MNYKKIHDSIIDRAKSRTLDPSTYYENHHILPKCEGGLQSGETVSLTVKEHRIVHMLRWKFTGVIENFYAYCMMTYDKREALHSIAAKMSHKKVKERDPVAYAERQRKAGIAGGKKAFERKSGFHGMSEEERKMVRDKGRNTTVKNKLGMFSDEYRKIHAENLKKKVLTPDGVFDSMTDAAKHYAVSPGTVTYRCSHFIDWEIVEVKEDNNVTNG